MRELPSLTIRPSCTATTCAFGALVMSTNRSAALFVDAPLAALAGAGAAEEPGAAAEDPEAACPAETPGVAAPVGLADGETALAPAVALDGEGSGTVAPVEAGRSSQPMRLPVTGGRPSTRPVRVAIT